MSDVVNGSGSGSTDYTLVPDSADRPALTVRTTSAALLPASSPSAAFLSSPNSATSLIPHTPLHKHRLHPAYSHSLLHLWHSDAPLLSHHLVFPLFIVDDDEAKQPIASLPGQFRWGVHRLPQLLRPLVDVGLRAVLLFGVVTDDSRKDAVGSLASSAESPVARAVRLLRHTFPSLYLMVDVCLCAYTSHGHCGVLLPTGEIDNLPSIARLAEMSVALATAGADCIAPSDMMDGRVGRIKQALAAAGLDHRVTVCSYAVKFASCFYGPFRDAAASGAKHGDRSRYQLPSASRSLALRAVDRDVEEGADMVMVKPAMPYLDLVREVKDRAGLPVAVYHVSGEYAMIVAGAQQGAFPLEAAVMETLGGFRRAGATVIVTYFAPLVLELLRRGQQV